jgi:3-dehydroquinate synthase
MNTLTVELGDRSYPIYIGDDLLQQAELLTRHIPAKQVMVVSNETVAPLYLEAVMASLGDYQAESVILPDGEEYKTLDTVNLIYDALLEKQFNRTATLVALGGGVVGDITGFAAATYQRGIHFIQIPTTLLAQVDSSVGGKTGVNHPLGKNMIGAFYQPRCVIADTTTLQTLDIRQLRAGISEVIKYGLINDSDFFAWLEQHIDDLQALDANTLTYAIEVSCQDKADIVAADERESGKRALLNLGHTFGHAIETAAGYGKWLHGEAVATGMYMAAELSRRLEWITAADVSRVRGVLEASHLPVHPPRDMTSADFMRLMSVDKKVVDGTIRLVLLRAIGEAVISSDFDRSRLDEMLAEMTA